MHLLKKILLSYFLILLSAFAFSQSNTEEINQKLLTGKWKSTDDRNYVIIVSDSIREYYKKVQTGIYSYSIKENRLIEISPLGEIYEYEITGLSTKNLTLMYLQRGNLLNFKRNKCCR